MINTSTMIPCKRTLYIKEGLGHHLPTCYLLLFQIFRTDLISAMKLPDHQNLSPENYITIADQWRQEWERGVQVMELLNQFSSPILILSFKYLVTTRGTYFFFYVFCYSEQYSHYCQTFLHCNLATAATCLSILTFHNPSNIFARTPLA